MKLPLTKKFHDSPVRGFTLIEMMVYIMLLSGILTVIVPYVYTTNEHNLKLIQTISAAYTG
jgi:prepilin-type N-terminal cleavage/methylation domain-containing protein